MKPCKHCGHVLADNARFCLFCMQRQEAPLSLVDPQFVSSFPRWKLRAAVGTATVALTGILSAVLITALSQINSSGSSALSEDDGDASDACEEITFSCAALLHPKMPENIKDTKSKTAREIPGIFFPLEVIIGFPLFLMPHVYFFIIALPF